VKGVKRPARQADHTPLYIVFEVKNEKLYIHPHMCLHGVHKDNFTFAVFVLLGQCFPNFFARGPLLVAKNNEGFSYPCSHEVSR
jgi:hypothetical protein